MGRIRLKLRIVSNHVEKVHGHWKKVVRLHWSLPDRKKREKEEEENFFQGDHTRMLLCGKCTNTEEALLNICT